MKKIKNLALVAHDNRKKDLVEWAEWNYETLIQHNIICTGTTGTMVEETLRNRVNSLSEEVSLKPITKLNSGPLGGDQQLGAMIAEGKVDVLVFFWDPMEPQPHDVDVKALLRIAVLYNIPTACNRSSADFIISSPLIVSEYERKLKDYSSYIQRDLR